MSNTVKLNTCPQCGAPIPAQAPQGLCPKCVLQGAAKATDAGVPPTATSEIPSIERIAMAFPHLEILELIGRGGMGFVFKARQPHLDRFVALKLLPDKLAKDAQFAERFNREGRVLAKLNHPSIVSVFDFGATGGFYYLLMEYVDGVNLRQAMQAGRFSPAEALSVVPKVCEALQYAHEQGILHRDIKPENILLDAKGRVKIADFGIAKLVGEEQSSVALTNTGAALGTLHYMAPEQLEKPSTVDHRADIYSLGVVFYELLTGELPIGRFAAPSSKTPVGANVDEVVFRTLEKDRERRFQSAGEMGTEVEHLGGSKVGTASEPRRQGETAAAVLPTPAWVKRPAQALWAVGVIILICGMGWFLSQSSHKKTVERQSLSAAPDLKADPNKPANEVEPMIQFTFTSVELREESGARWLAMDYDEQVRGECQHTFRYDARVPGFKGQTRMESSLSDAKAGFAPVLHHRVLWKLPDSLPQTDALALRDLVAKEWNGKSIAVEPGDERVLFKTLIPTGGTLATAIGVRLQKTGQGSPQENAIGSARLIAGRDYQNLAIARIESMPGHPLHQIIARFAGPEIPEQAVRAPSILSGPHLVPSPDEDMKTPAEPVDGSMMWGTNRAPVASAISFECPGDYVLQFVLPDEDLARDAARQMNQALAQPLSLVPGRPVQLFTAGKWNGWLETRPFQPTPNRLAFFRHPGRSPAQIPGTNSIESVVATIPPGHELKLTGRVVMNGVNQSEPAFSTTLSSEPNEPGVYWFTWYASPNPQNVLDGVKQSWELQIHDPLGSELYRSLAPETLKIDWRRRWIGEPATVRSGKPITQILFEKPFREGDRSVTFVLLEMIMQPSVQITQRMTVQLEFLLKREQELLARYTPEHPVVKEIRQKIAETRKELNLLEPTP